MILIVRNGRDYCLLSKIKMTNVTCGNCGREYPYPGELPSINCACGRTVFKPKEEPKPPEPEKKKEPAKEEKKKSKKK